MKDYWERLEILLSTYLPELLANLNPGCTAREVDSLEQELGITLPKDFKSFYLIHNGQNSFSNDRLITGLFFGLEFLSLEGIIGNGYVNVFNTKRPEKSHFLDAVPLIFSDDVEL